MSVSRTSHIAMIDSVRQLGREYDAWLVDLWGVLHNGAEAIVPAVEACERFRAEGGIVLLISNAPRPQDSVREQIMRYGVPPSVDDGIITSGDVTRGLIEANADKPIFHIGPERDRTLFEGLDVSLVEPEDAELVVLSGLWDDDTETPEDYRRLLQQLQGEGLPMICANPDVKVERGAQVIYAAGAIAGLYEQLGGTVEYAGKPHPPIYHRALEMIDELAGRQIPRQGILAIGDGINTDILGAARAGIDPLFVLSGIHTADGMMSERDLAALFAGGGCRPIAAMQELQW
jgi:HAD superfamily hydrolase (TIGR01459 family)